MSELQEKLKDLKYNKINVFDKAIHACKEKIVIAVSMEYVQLTELTIEELLDGKLKEYPNEWIDIDEITLLK